MEEKEILKISNDLREQAKKEICNCMHPNCPNKAINSHIMQKNGVLSSISPDRHLWELSVNNFKKKIEFRKRGINNIYTFLGFCNEHDTNLFKKIESKEGIDLNDYESCLLLALRTACNEYRLKEINIRWYEYLLKNNNIKHLYQKDLMEKHIEENKLGLKDLDFYIQAMWNDLQNKTQSFVFNHRKIEKLELCLNSIYTYDTSLEMRDYILKNGKDMERTSEIFISFFPYNDESILLMGYHKSDESKVKSFVNLFFKENEKRVKRRISSLIIFNCETWVCSNELYHSKFVGLDSEFNQAFAWSFYNGNERKTFNVNIYDSNFKENLKKELQKHNN